MPICDFESYLSEIIFVNVAQSGAGLPSSREQIRHICKGIK